MRQLTKLFRNARSWHGSQLFIEEEDRVCLGLRLGLCKRRNGGLDCCCHRNSSLLVDIGRAESRPPYAPHLSTRHESFNQNRESARRSNERGIWTLILVNTSDRHQEVPSRLLSYAISRLGSAAALNQDRTAIHHNGLPSAESFLHQKQIGLRYVMSLADSANRETLSHAFV